MLNSICHISGDLLCGEDEFACRSRRCVSLLSCRNCTAFSCGPSDKCLSGTQLCDGQADCRDGRDESRTLCGSSRLNVQTCKSSEFRCGDGRCIPLTWRCDNSMDCADGNDEVNCGESTSGTAQYVSFYRCCKKNIVAQML